MSTELLDDVRDVTSLTLAPFDVDQYHRLIEAGILRDGEPIELIEGVLVYKDRRDEVGGIKTHGGRHLKALNKLTALLSEWVRGRNAFLQVQGPITLNERNEPEPDCSLIAGDPDSFGNGVPDASAVHAVFEVADSSLSTDRTRKWQIYAAAAIPVYVIVNLKDQQIEVHSLPSPNESKYHSRQEYGRGESFQVDVGNLGPLSIPVDDLF
jgi:hypothetical protein